MFEVADSTLKNVCRICYDNNINDNIKCSTCNNKICLKCLVNIRSKEQIETDDHSLEYFYKCPYCRNEIKIDFNELEKYNKGIFKELYGYNLIRFSEQMRLYNDIYNEKEEYGKIIDTLLKELEEHKEKEKNNDVLNQINKLIKDRKCTKRKTINIDDILKVIEIF